MKSKKLDLDYDDLKNTTLEQNKSKNQDGSLGFALIVAVVFIAIAVAIYFIYRVVQRYFLTKEIEVAIILLHPENPSVGGTITCRIRFRKKGGKFIPGTSEIFEKLGKDISIIPETEFMKRPVAVLTETYKSNNQILGKFSVRKAGLYTITVKYDMFDLAPIEEFKMQVLPGPPSPKYMDFGTHNPQILCATAGIYQNFKMLAEDQYGNICQINDVELEKLGFQLYHMGNPYPIQQEFCYHKHTSTQIDQNTETKIDTCSVNVCLKVKVNQPGVYNCFLKYDRYLVHSGHGMQKILVCLKPNEETELQATFSKLIIPGTLIYTNECKLTAMADEVGYSEYYFGISTSWLVFSKYRIPLSLYPDISFPINPRTRITYYDSQTTNGDNDDDETVFVVEDGIRPTVRVKMNASFGRIFLIIFAHNQGFLLERVKKSFQEKKEDLKYQLSGYFSGFSWLTSEKVLHIQPGNLIRSSIKEVPRHPDDWVLPFKVIFEGSSYQPSSMKPATALTSEQDWINLLCEEFFKGQGESALFKKLSGSKLLHPTSSTLSQQPLEYYRLAGQILAKAVCETLLRGICTQLSQVRFTRSVLAFILGFPIDYKVDELTILRCHQHCLEADEPKYFRKIRTILEEDIDSLEYKFTTFPSSTSDTNMVNLIPNGSTTPVTNANKEHYLNLLTNHRLIHRVEQELTAFRNGFYEVIDKDKFSDFQQDDLQKLISGGCAFNISDLKAHHRVVKEVDNGFLKAIGKQSVDTKKVLNWFWVALENFSEEEQAYFLFFTTGSFSLPSCGLANLNPNFTISLTGTFNQPPKGHPISNEIVLADHACFENFENTLLYAIKPKSEKILLPTTDAVCADMLCLEESRGCEMEDDGNDRTTTTTEEGASVSVLPQLDLWNPILDWLMERAEI